MTGFHQLPGTHLDTLNYSDSKFSLPKLADSLLFLWSSSQEDQESPDMLTHLLNESWLFPQVRNSNSPQFWITPQLLVWRLVPTKANARPQSPPSQLQCLEYGHSQSEKKQFFWDPLCKTGKKRKRKKRGNEESLSVKILTDAFVGLDEMSFKFIGKCKELEIVKMLF